MSMPMTTARRLVELACNAPSVHNTQPWLWRIDGNQVRLHADHRRQLPAEDPDGRSLVISCGAALHQLQFAARALGWTSEVARTPRGDDPTLLAEVTFERGPASSQPVNDLAALRRRCTDRRRFTSWPVPDDILERLAGEARTWSAAALPITDLVSRFRLELLSNEATMLRESDPVAVGEQTAWVDRSDHDGVPLKVLPRVEQNAPPEDRRNRFGPGLVPETRTPVDGGDGVIVLGGRGDETADWLRTGEALSALWLRATRDGLSVVPLSLPVEIESIRFAMAESVLEGAFLPHLAVRIGWQAIGRTGLPRTPRRALDTVLLA
ncbi:Acg family FMN-binding oxidoreductase [Nocardioides stalactiti]|uniref:Acg family FMN-binding oxidoreductase n=1 Tax=Nocardioides stalactiti TaxID=2755356 RepID=UPI0016004A08|nr:NAD(P)H nitroreductase [Nocardioides stalactiti]